MNNQQSENPKAGKWVLPAALVPIICCGGLVLLPLIGTAFFATLAGFLLHPLVQLGGAAIMAVGITVLWRRTRHTTRVTQKDVQSPSNYASNSDEEGIASIKER